VETDGVLYDVVTCLSFEVDGIQYTHPSKRMYGGVPRLMIQLINDHYDNECITCEE